MKKILLISILALFTIIAGRAQAPGNIPYGEPKQLELTPFNIILYFVIPVLLFVALILIRRKRNKEKDKKSNE